MNFAAKKKVMLFVKRQLQRKLYDISNFAYSCPCPVSFLNNLPEAPFFTEVAPLPPQPENKKKSEIVNKGYSTNNLINIVNDVNSQDFLLPTGMPQIISGNRIGNNCIFTESCSLTIHTQTSEEACNKKDQKMMSNDEYPNIYGMIKSKENSEIVIFVNKTKKKFDDFSDISADNYLFKCNKFSEVQIICENVPTITEVENISKSNSPETSRPLPVKNCWMDSLSTA
jgi:hypothetical protein